MPGSERLIQVLALGEGENAGGKGNSISLNNDAAIVNRIVWEENGLNHFRSGFAIDHNAGFDNLLELNGLFDGNEGANPRLRQTFGGLNDHLDVLALLASRIEEREVAQLRQHPAQLRLKNDEHGETEDREKVLEEEPKDFELKRAAQQGHAEDDRETNDDGPSTGATDE